MSSNTNQTPEVENEDSTQVKNETEKEEENNEASNEVKNVASKEESGEVKVLSSEKAQNAASNNEGIVLRDLESLLQKSIDNRVSVIDYEASSLLPVGENYGSSILKVVVNVKMTESSPEEKLHLVAKTPPKFEFNNIHLKTSLIFRNEIFVFDKVAPAYREIEAESIDEESLIELFPKFYGGRLTKNEREPDEADEDAVILLENLKLCGYDNMNRKEGDFYNCFTDCLELKDESSRFF